MKVKNCLFDLDGTLCDHTGALLRDLEKIQSPTDPPISRYNDNEPDYIKARKKLIRSQRDWWANLETMKLGFDLYYLARSIGFRINVLTKGPWTSDYAWSEKVIWCRKHLYHDVKITITEDKSLVYGRVLVDDYTEYVKGWLKWRPRGLVVMPLNEQNKNFKHPQVIHYDGTNLNEVLEKMTQAYNRE